MSAHAPSDVAGIPSNEWDWSQLMENLWPALLSSGQRKFGLSREDCEDAIQQVAQEIIQRRPRARMPEAYLRNAYYRHCCDVARARGRFVALESVSEFRHEPGGRMEAECDVTNALGRVSPRCRELITAYALEGRTLPETADWVGSSKVTIWKRIHKCLGKLEIWLKRDVTPAL